MRRAESLPQSQTVLSLQNKFFLVHVRLHLLQMLPDGKLLGADLFALTAFYTILCLCGFPKLLLPSALHHTVILVHMIGIPDFKIAGNIYSRRTGHTIIASRTSVLHAAVNQRYNFIDLMALLFGQRPEGTESLQIVFHLFHGRHSKLLLHWADFPPSAAQRKPPMPPDPGYGTAR